ncbi:hypothetical protein [Spirosoma aerophilum]
MKKVSLFLFVLMLSVCLKATSKPVPPTDFFAGKWEVLIIGTPNGDAKMTANLVRKDGKLTGELVSSGADAPKEPIPITKIEEGTDKVHIYFTSQGYDVDLELTKVDDDHLKGSLMSMFDSTAVRLKN